MAGIRVLIFSGYGINCEYETKFAFERAADLLGVDITVSVVHINSLIGCSSYFLMDYQILVVPGGFSYGDDIGAGYAYASRIRNNLGSQFEVFLEDDKDGVVLGICNGCQILVNLLDEFKGIDIVLNKGQIYRCLWVDLKVSESSASSFWFEGMDFIRLPIAHAEGRFDFGFLKQIDDFAILSYLEDVNGSQDCVAAISGYGGKVMAMMPHPERAVLASQRDDFYLLKDSALRKGDVYEEYGVGLKMFINIVKRFSDI